MWRETAAERDGGGGTGKSFERHEKRLETVVRQLKERRSKRPVSLRKKAPSHQVPKPRDLKYSDEKIDLTELREILEINPEARTCTAEPGVTFDELVRATLPYGLAPIIVPELSTITLGGAVSGCSIESMSFRHGGFHDTCLEYEVITAKGDVLRCTPDNEHQLIFQMLHGSFGTVGILSKLKSKLVPAKPFVHMVYERHRTLESYQASIRRHAEVGDIDFMDGIIHSPTLYVLSLGTFVNEAPYTHNYDWVKVYYQSTARRKEDYLRTRDYYFRYDRGVTNPFPHTALGRFVFGKFIRSHESLRLGEKLHRLLPFDRPRVTLDVFIPFSRVPAFLDWYQQTIGHFPLWVVPYRRVRDYEWLSSEFWKPLDDELFVDLAIYGLEQPKGRNYYKEIEDELQRVNGVKTLISHNYYDEDVFWKIWNRDNYETVKKVTDPDNIFRDLYTKTCVATKGLESDAT